MLYYNNEISQQFPKLLKYFENGIKDNDKNISHCLLFWGADTKSQCELALEVARILNCSESGDKDCTCLNCKWIREQTHPGCKRRRYNGRCRTGSRTVFHTVSINRLPVRSAYPDKRVPCRIAVRFRE